jgi:hypothetical protein
MHLCMIVYDQTFLAHLVSRQRTKEFLELSETTTDHIGMNCLRPLEHCDRGFESHSRHECVCVYPVCVR